MTTKVKLSVSLSPIGKPWVGIRCGDYKKYQQLTSPTKFDIEFDTDLDQLSLFVEHAAKADYDPETAVVIDSVSFFGISDPQFVWSGIYYPDYPGHYPDKTTPLPGHSYLSWNGVYQLDFEVPVFSWMHQKLNLGWLYQ